MKSFVTTFMEENANVMYCGICLQPVKGCDCKVYTNEHIAFKEFDATTQLEIMKEELRNAYN
jgi:hypothetical protein